jgi:Fe-Mn family superoxide dismutase
MKYPYKLPQLPYGYDALEPHIDARTMEIHHTKHHQTYVDKLNAAMEKWPEGQEMELEEILKNLNAVPEAIRQAVRNHGGGHYNHSLFWNMLEPDGASPNAGRSRASPGVGRPRGEPQGELAAAMQNNFGDFAKFKEAFTAAALGVFGSGWVWLTLSKAKGLALSKAEGLVTENPKSEIRNSKLSIVTTPNQDTPISQGLTPIIGLDVWEHAYYLKYQNRRADYVAAWWNVVKF